MLTSVSNFTQKMLKFTQFCIKELKEKSAFLKIAALAFEARDLFSSGFCLFEAHFLIKLFLVKKRVSH